MLEQPNTGESLMRQLAEMVRQLAFTANAFCDTAPMDLGEKEAASSHVVARRVRLKSVQEGL